VSVVLLDVARRVDARIPFARIGISHGLLSQSPRASALSKAWFEGVATVRERLERWDTWVPASGRP